MVLTYTTQAKASGWQGCPLVAWALDLRLGQGHSFHHHLALGSMSDTCCFEAFVRVTSLGLHFTLRFNSACERRGFNSLWHTVKTVNSWCGLALSNM